MSKHVFIDEYGRETAYQTAAKVYKPTIGGRYALEQENDSLLDIDTVLRNRHRYRTATTHPDYPPPVVTEEESEELVGMPVGMTPDELRQFLLPDE